MPFYVGKGMGKRSHELRATRRSEYHRRVIEKIGVENIIIWKLDCDSEQAAFTLEKYLIAHYRRIGAKLCNFTDGGEGASGCVQSDETRRKKSIGMMGKRTALGTKRTPETRAKMSAWQIGRKMSPEAIAKMSAAKIGRKLSPETCAKLSIARIGNKNSVGRKDGVGRKHSSETLTKMSLSHIGQKAWNKGKKLSPEHCAKLSESHKRKLP